MMSTKLCWKICTLNCICQHGMNLVIFFHFFVFSLFQKLFLISRAITVTWRGWQWSLFFHGNGINIFEAYLSNISASPLFSPNDLDFSFKKLIIMLAAKQKNGFSSTIWILLFLLNFVKKKRMQNCRKWVNIADFGFPVWIVLHSENPGYATGPVLGNQDR